MKNHEKTIQCDRKGCDREQRLDEMEIKMGGLLCVRCRKILVWPSDPVFREEMLRRRENDKSV